MINTNLVLGDILFAAALGLIYATDGLKNNTIILMPLITIAFAACIVRHINYYKQTRRIY